MARWFPHVTVAAVIEKDSQFLMVEENFEGYMVFNQPAGHLNKDENLLEAVSREVLVESGWQFIPKFLVGIYQYVDLYNHETYIRFSFCGELGDHEPDRALEPQINSVAWLTKGELFRSRLKSPIVLRSVNDYLNGYRNPIDIISFI